MKWEGVGVWEVKGVFTCVYALGCQQLCSFDSSIERLHSTSKRDEVLTHTLPPHTSHSPPLQVW